MYYENNSPVHYSMCIHTFLKFSSTSQYTEHSSNLPQLLNAECRFSVAGPSTERDWILLGICVSLGSLLGITLIAFASSVAITGFRKGTDDKIHLLCQVQDTQNYLVS